MERIFFEGEAAQAITRKIKALDGYESLVAMKPQSLQAFDVVVVRTSLRRLEVMVDVPLEHRYGLDRAERILKIMSAISLQIPLLKEIGSGLRHINLFSAINGMYRDKNGGVLQSIKVRTSTGLLDHLRTTLTADDLRQNKYHTASTNAVNNEVDPFDILTRLDLTMPAASVTIHLSASVGTLGGPPETRWLHGLEILDCVSQRDAIRAVNRVISFSS